MNGRFGGVELKFLEVWVYFFTYSIKFLVFYEKIDFYLKNKFKLLGEKRRVVYDLI